MSKTLLITGATGHQGGAVINALLDSSEAPKNFTLIALTRNIHSSAATALEAKSSAMKLIEGNLNEPEAIFIRAATQIWGVFSVQNPMGRGASVEIEERQGKALVDAAIKHNVKHFVYASVDRHGARSDTDPTHVPHFTSKYRVEKYLQERTAATCGGMTWTILRPTGFMENFSSPPFTPAFMGKVFASVWRYAIPEDVPMQLISTVDVGWFGAQAFVKSQSKEYRNTAISLAADELTFNEASRICKEKAGFEMPTTFSIVAWAVLKVLSDVRVMFEWFAMERLDADIDECRRLHPSMMTFGQWVEKESGYVRK
jgi:nucleoside-diphosphate-sugar epimerase